MQAAGDETDFTDFFPTVVSSETLKAVREKRNPPHARRTLARRQTIPRRPRTRALALPGEPWSCECPDCAAWAKEHPTP